MGSLCTKTSARATGDAGSSSACAFRNVRFERKHKVFSIGDETISESKVRKIQCVLRDPLFEDNEESVDLFTSLSKREPNSDETKQGCYRMWVPCFNFDIEALGYKPKLTITVVGDTSVGKSTLVLRLIASEFIHEYDPTIEDVYSKELTLPQSTKINVDIIDTAFDGEHSLEPETWMKNTDILVICADLSRSDVSLEDQWLSHLQKYSRHHDLDIQGRSEESDSWSREQCAAMVLVGTKADLSRGSDCKAGLECSRQWNMPYVECSAKYNINVDLVFQCAVYEYWLCRDYFRSPDLR